jgi:ribose/xylose/arabinose/galactoside ABC-type transport system permease subunit
MQNSKKIAVDPNKFQIFIVTCVLVLMVVGLAISNDKFLTVLNISNLFRQSAFVIIVGCAATLLVVAGGIDISVGGVLAFNCVFFAVIIRDIGSIPLAFVLCTLAGGLVGVLNGITSVKLNIPAIVATMGSMYLMKGLAFVICDATPISLANMDGVSYMGRAVLFGIIPIPMILMIIIIAIFLFIERKTILGKYAIAIGANRTAAMLAGIDTNKVLITLFVLTGLLAGFAGALMGSRLSVGEARTGTDFEFDVMIAVILGGTDIKGGQGRVIGTVMGGLLLSIINNGMDLLRIDPFYQYIVKGIVLIVSMLLTLVVKSGVNKGDIAGKKRPTQGQ